MRPERYGFCIVRYRQRHKQGAPQGLRSGWDEYQVWHGRKIVSRHELKHDAITAARAHNEVVHDERIARAIAENGRFSKHE